MCTPITCLEAPQPSIFFSRRNYEHRPWGCIVMETPRTPALDKPSIARTVDGVNSRIPYPWVGRGSAIGNPKNKNRDAQSQEKRQQRIVEKKQQQQIYQEHISTHHQIRNVSISSKRTSNLLAVDLSLFTHVCLREELLRLS